MLVRFRNIFVNEYRGTITCSTEAVHENYDNKTFNEKYK